jgi:carboxyl-terminal processing protease
MEQNTTTTKISLPQKVVSLLGLVLCMVLVFFAGVMHGSQAQSISDLVVSLKGGATVNNGLMLRHLTPDMTAHLDLFWRSWDLLQEKYVDKDKLNTDDMMYGAIKGMLASTGDPYTTFFDPKESKEFQEEMTGSFQGIGAEIGKKDDVITVVTPLDESPAQKAGILAGDKILKIDDASTMDMDLDKAVSLIRGIKDTWVTLTIFRSTDKNQTKEIRVQRDAINVKSVKMEMKDSFAVIKVNRFGDDTGKGFHDAVKSAVAHKAKGIAIDLRNNPGGYLDVAVSMASFLLPAQKIVVIEEDSNGNRKSIYAKGGDIASGFKTVVLINEGSASASEILAGALRDNRNNVTLVGKKSFGKGSVQELTSLTKDTSVKITVAKWLTPNGKQINHEGIAPDVEVAPSDNQDASKPNQDTQMEKALELLREESSQTF